MNNEKKDIIIYLERSLQFGKDAFKDGLSFNPIDNKDFLSFFADDNEIIEVLAEAYVLGWSLEEIK